MDNKTGCIAAVTSRDPRSSYFVLADEDEEEEEAE